MITLNKNFLSTETEVIANGISSEWLNEKTSPAGTRLEAGRGFNPCYLVVMVG